MSTTFENIILKTELSQSILFGEVYDEFLDSSRSLAYNNSLVEDVAELINSIMLEYDILTEFQKEMLGRIFNEFNNIRINIDPNRLKPFQHYFNEDCELLLYRESEKGLTNIIINPEECIAFSYIPKSDEVRKFYFIDEDGDFETLAYHFFAF